MIFYDDPACERQRATRKKHKAVTQATAYAHLLSTDGRLA
jgi:hypothetical protein